MKNPFDAMLKLMHRLGVHNFQNSYLYQSAEADRQMEIAKKQHELAAAEQHRRFNEQLEMANQRRAMWDIDC